MLQFLTMKGSFIRCGVVGLALAACACDSSKTCTLIGCNDRLVVEISLSSGLAALFSAQLDIDGRAVSCPAPAKGESATCDTDVTIA